MKTIDFNTTELETIPKHYATINKQSVLIPERVNIFNGTKDCPYCNQEIGFVEFQIQDERIDECPKSNCKGLFIYAITK